MFAPYSEYKSSKSEWLKKIPKHWPVERLRFNVCFNPSKTEARQLDSSTQVSFVPMEAVGEYGGMRLDETRTIAEVINGYTYFKEEDVVIAKITPCFENGKGALAKGLMNGTAFGTTELQVLRPRQKFIPQHLFYITISHPFRSIGKSHMYGAGGQKRVPEDYIKNLEFPIPPIEEQLTIAKFLDRETTRIDTLIAKKQRQIKLLQEKRSALISHVVTKGLDPNVKMKDSGIEWLGEIPEGWKRIRLKHLTSHIVDCLHSTPIYSDDGPYFAIRTADVSPGMLDLTHCKRVDREEYDRRVSRLAPTSGDVVYSREGERFGMAALVPKKIQLCLSQRMMMFRCKKGMSHPDFLMWQLNGGPVYQQAEQDVLGSTSPHVNVATIRNLWLTLPQYEEQIQISQFINKAVGQLDSLQSKINSSIELLKEYRTALITAAVTGKIDVRQEATHARTAH